METKMKNKDYLALERERLELKKQIELQKLELRKRRISLQEEQIALSKKRREEKLAADAERPQKEIERAEHQARTRSLRELTGFRVPVWDNDLANFRTIVYEITRVRQPAIQFGDIFSSAPPTSRIGDGGNYGFYCFQEDMAFLKETARSAWAAGLKSPVTEEQIQAKRKEALDAAAAEEASKQEWPEESPEGISK